ncbi:hypothetical protein FDUTEX481_02596 [Tolypothrix sp. PCC 7601]|nr:hypothetical protein FDUTEX481_02596 [Tolypothrix sp. PCC 7601]
MTGVGKGLKPLPFSPSPFPRLSKRLWQTTTSRWRNSHIEPGMGIDFWESLKK